jgi:hypothetical protein
VERSSAPAEAGRFPRVEASILMNFLAFRGSIWGLLGPLNLLTSLLCRVQIRKQNLPEPRCT